MTGAPAGTFDLLRLGAVAAEIILHAGEIEVAAVFERCFYVSAPGGYLCVGTEALGDGPLNILLRTSDEAPDWPRFGITREAKGSIAAGCLSIGEQFILRLTDALIWSPQAWPKMSAPELRTGLAVVRQVATPLCPSEGLSRLVFGGSARLDLTAQAAAPTLAQFAKALPTALTAGKPDDDLVRSATLLVGLGPGLTPSGDDFLGGVFLALSALNGIPLREAMWHALEPEIGLLTVDISGAHLAAAADGLGAAVVHAAIAAIITNDRAGLLGSVPTLRALGHSSGFDTLAGIVLTLETALASGYVA